MNNKISIDGRTFWFDADHYVYAVIDTETGNLLPFRHERIESGPPVAPKYEEFVGGLGLRRRNPLRLQDAFISLGDGVKLQDHGDAGADPAHIGGLAVLRAEREPAPASVHGLLDRALHCVELIVACVGGIESADRDLAHDSSSPLSEGAGTPCDPSVDEAAGPRPDSPQDAGPEAGEQP